MTAMLNPAPRWSHARGNTVVPSRWQATHGLLDGCEIEPIVGVVIEHLENIQMRTPGQMVDAGGLVAAEVRLVLQQLTGGIYQPAVHVVMWSDSTAQITNFPLNEGTHHVWLFYTPGHFDLIHRSAT